MKHLLNNLSEQEKNSIREQHTGGMTVMTKNFSRLLKSKSGDVKTLVKEQMSSPTLGEIGNAVEIGATTLNLLLTLLPISTVYNLIKSGLNGDAKTFGDIINKEKQRLGANSELVLNAVTKGDISKNVQKIATELKTKVESQFSQLKAGMGNDISSFQ